MKKFLPNPRDNADIIRKKITRYANCYTSKRRDYMIIHHKHKHKQWPTWMQLLIN